MTDPQPKRAPAFPCAECAAIWRTQAQRDLCCTGGADGSLPAPAAPDPIIAAVQPVQGQKRCGKCQATKRLEDFYVCSSRKDGRQYACKACKAVMEKARSVDPEARALSAETRRKYRAANLDRLQAQEAKWRADNKQLRKARAAAHRAANIDLYRQREKEARARNKKQRAEYAAAQAAAGLRRGKGGWAKWREKYPLANRSNASQQRAIRRKVCVQKVDLLAIFERDGWRCYICGVTCDPAAKRCTTLAAEADHVIPISRGGAHSEDNIRCACFLCNRAKAARSEPPKYYVAEIDKKTLK